MLKFKIYAFAALTAAMLCASCDSKPQWTVDGRIEGADGETMIVEANNNGTWYPLDSVKLDASGSFSIKQPAAGYPDIYRLRLGGKTLYFPIDSIETVTVVTTASAFDSEYTLSGTEAAEQLMNVEHRVAELLSKSTPAGVVNDSLFKRELGGILLKDPSGIVSYYIINKRIGGMQLFDPARPSDLKIIGAVANAFDHLRPSDPRTNYLRNLYLQNRRRSAAAPRDTLAASIVKVFDISLHDNNGKLRSLEQLAAQGKVIVLNFTAYQADESPAFNRELNRVYEKYAGRGMEIFQVSVDEDEYAWRQAAAPLPWITVLNPIAGGAENITNYNVVNIPTTYIIDRHGDLVERVDNINELEGAVLRHI